MNNPESLIDTTQFGIVADYLRNPKTPIDMILHAKDRPTLVELARRLGEAYDSGPNSSEKIEAVVKEFISDGRLRISSTQPMGPTPNARVIDVSNVARETSCEVIYMPPFYLTHTPGLLAHELETVIDAPRSTNAPQAPSTVRMKP